MNTMNTDLICKSKKKKNRKAKDGKRIPKQAGRLLQSISS